MTGAVHELFNEAVSTAYWSGAFIGCVIGYFVGLVVATVWGKLS